MKDEIIVRKVSELLIDKPHMIAKFKSLLSNSLVLNPEEKLNENEKGDVLLKKIEAINPDWLIKLKRDENFKSYWENEAHPAFVKL